MSSVRICAVGGAIVLLCGLGRVQATTWSAVYPYVQKTEDGKVTCRSVPYGVRDGPGGLGETFVYYRGELLYTIDEYFSSALFTLADGRYLVSVRSTVRFPQHANVFGPDGKQLNEAEELDGDVVRIFDKGVPFRTILFSELGIDRTRVQENELASWFNWAYDAPSEATGLAAKMSKHPMYQEGDTLSLITADDQLIKVHIPTGTIVSRATASKILDAKTWKPTAVKRNYQGVRYPHKFFLPPLADGRSLAAGVGALLSMVPCDDHARDGDVEIYVHTLLVNDQGVCEQVHLSVTLNDPAGDHRAVEDRLLVWIKEQRFDTRTIPRRFGKFKYSDFIRLDHPGSGP